MENQFRAFFIATYGDGSKIIGFGEGTDGVVIQELIVNTTPKPSSIYINNKMRVLERYAYYINQMPIQENRRDALKAIFQKL